MSRRKDGYHNIDTMMQTISLHDDLVFREIDQGIEIDCNDRAIPIDKRNICYKAADLLIKKFKLEKGINISIRKRIPAGAGLGGGSSNAAATLIALNKLWNLRLSKKKLIALAANLGADVPFFLIGGRCVCGGVGDEIRKVQSTKYKVQNERKSYYVLIMPDVSVSTKWAYHQYDESTKSKVKSTKYKYGNDLEAVVTKKYPIIQKIKDDLIHAGCGFAQMTGSGSAVFGVVKNKTQGNQIYENLRKKYRKIYLVSEVDKNIIYCLDKSLRCSRTFFQKISLL